jgi:DNA-directed RNA polymerase sigma subunit (sigma70/sigma32)
VPREALNQSIGKLSLKECTVLLLRFGLDDGWPYEIREIARILDRGDAAVSQLLLIALWKMREESNLRSLSP